MSNVGESQAFFRAPPQGGTPVVEELFYLPPYSPHLNPDGQVWAHVKRSVSKRLVQSKGEVSVLPSVSCDAFRSCRLWCSPSFTNPDASCFYVKFI